MDVAPFIHLRPKAATSFLHLAADASSSESRRISFHADLERTQHVLTADGRSLRGAEWTVLLQESETFNEAVAAEGAIGNLWHIEESVHNAEGCHILALVKPHIFASLLDTLRAGQLPDSVSIEVRGLSYARVPDDGETKEWDVKQNPHPSVLSMSFRVPTAVPPPVIADDATREKPSIVPVTPADLRAVETSLLTTATELHQRSLSTLRLVLGLVFVLVLVVLFK